VGEKRGVLYLSMLSCSEIRSAILVRERNGDHSRPSRVYRKWSTQKKMIWKWEQKARVRGVGPKL
jgi:hypothetical protein